MIAAEGNPALNEVRARLEIVASRVRGYMRARAPRKPPRASHDTACRLCRRQGHTRGACPLRGLDVFTDGLAVVLARSAVDAADVVRVRWHPPLAKPRKADWYLLAADADDRFTIAGVTATLRSWARANGRGVLAGGGVLAPGRKVPR